MIDPNFAYALKNGNASVFCKPGPLKDALTPQERVHIQDIVAEDYNRKWDIEFMRTKASHPLGKVR